MVYNTIFIGKVRIHLNKIDSTNNYAAQLLKSETPTEGIIVSTDHQFAGKGQRGNTWLTEAGENLTLSIVLYPKFLQAHRQFLLSQSIALGVRSFAADFLGTEVTVKWPNDIYYQDQKIAGILIESALMGKKMASAIVGIGVNINQSFFPTFVQNATSFRQITGQNYNLNVLIEELSKHIEVHYLQLKTGNFRAIQQNYLSHLYRFNTWHLFEDTSNGNVFKGKIVDVQEDGKLVLEERQTANGGRWTVNDMRRVFDLKEVRFVFE